MTFLGIVILFQVMRKKEKVITHGTNTIYLIGLLYTLSFFSCSTEQEQDNTSAIESPLTGPYTIESSQLLENGQEVHFKGVNALQTYGLTDAGLMNHWKVQITREFIGNLREQPIDGGAIQASDGVWYHPLQQIVDQNRANNRITILCPFGWVNNNGERQLFTGLNPSEQSFYSDYKDKMRQIAQQFSDQPDVWIELWNEPYHWNNENGYTHALWLADMEDMVNNLRQVEGFENIIIVPGNEQGQSEDVLLANGNALMSGRFNLLFDLHAYEKWLLDQTEEDLVARIQTIRNAGIPFIIGEVGVQNVGEIMPVQPFLNAAQNTQLTTLAWVWNLNSSDNNALLTDEGTANATATNNFWGTTFQAFLNN